MALIFGHSFVTREASVYLPPRFEYSLLIANFVSMSDTSSIIVFHSEGKERVRKMYEEFSILSSSQKWSEWFERKKNYSLTLGVKNTNCVNLLPMRKIPRICIHFEITWAITEMRHSSRCRKSSNLRGTETSSLNYKCCCINCQKSMNYRALLSKKIELQRTCDFKAETLTWDENLNATETFYSFPRASIISSS